MNGTRTVKVASVFESLARTGGLAIAGSPDDPSMVRIEHATVGGHGAEPNEQNTQQPPGGGRSRVPQESQT